MPQGGTSAMKAKRWKSALPGAETLLAGLRGAVRGPFSSLPSRIITSVFAAALVTSFAVAYTATQSTEVFPSLEDPDDIYSKLDTRLKVTINGSLFAQLRWVMDWDNTPASGNKRVDNLYLLTLGWTF